jgi:large subunit ribosomal protein L28
MPYVCHFTGRKTTIGKTKAYGGQRVSKGGFGLKTTGISPRAFRPNLQKLRAVIDGRPQRVLVSANAIKTGMVVKPLKRKYGYTRQQKSGD